MRITALVENTTTRNDLVAEHGLSLLVEANGRSVLFDSGQSDAIIGNAVTLGIDLSRVSAAVLSHGHFDHSGGFGAFLQANGTSPIYARKGCELGHYRGDEYIGVDPSLIDDPRFQLIDGPRDLGDGFTIVSYVDDAAVVAVDHDNLEEEDMGGQRHLERFTHEQCLIVEEGSARVLISGCSHRGIVNYMSWTQDSNITHVIGGLHLMRLPLESERIAATAEALLDYPVQYTTCHCTGTSQYKLLKGLMGDRLGYLSTGDTLEIVQ